MKRLPAILTLLASLLLGAIAAAGIYNSSFDSRDLLLVAMATGAGLLLGTALSAVFRRAA